MKKFIFIIILFISIKGITQSSLLTQDTLANNPLFRQRVKSANINAANQIAADTSQANYVLQYANVVINAPDGGWISAMTYQVVANPVINYGSPDGDIQFAVNSNFEKVARAYFNVIIPPPGVLGVRRYLNQKMHLTDR